CLELRPTIARARRGDLRRTLERQAPRQRLAADFHRVRRRSEQQPAVFEPEESLLLGTDVIGTPRRLDVKRDAVLLVVNRARPGVGDIRAEYQRLHLLASWLCGIERGDVARHDLQVARATVDDDRSD